MLSVSELVGAKLEHAWGSKTTNVSAAPGGGAEATDLSAAHKLAASLPPAIEGHGGDAALFRVACELATIVGENAAGIATVLRETYNPRCVPPWPESKLKREAERACEREATPEGRMLRRRKKRAGEERERYTRNLLEEGDVDWGVPEEPITWYCKELAIAPSERKITLIGGNPGAGKGPLAGYLATCFALGLKLFGQYEVLQCNVGILDFEGARLSSRRIRSYCRGFGVDPKNLTGRLHLKDTNATAMLDPTWVQEWVEQKSIEVLIIDSYMSAMLATDSDPNSPEYARLAQDLGTLGIVVIVVAHARKPVQTERGARPALGDIAGSYALGGMAATGIAVWKPDEEDDTLCRVGCMRAPEGAFPTRDIRWRKSQDGLEWRGSIESEATKVGRKQASEDETLTKHARALIRHMRPNASFPQSINALSKATGIHHRYVGAVMSRLAAHGMAEHQPATNGRTAGEYILTDLATDIVELRGDRVEVRTT